jgi:hypothetical protein
MTVTFSATKEFYTEQEAIEVLGISSQRLHMLLDQNVFSDGAAKPATLSFRAQDLIVIEYWHLSAPARKVVKMPCR